MTGASDSKRITTERRGAIFVVTIDRPEARNAFDNAASREMEAAMDLFEQDPELHVGVVTGANGVFCAGADLKGIAAGLTNSQIARQEFLSVKTVANNVSTILAKLHLSERGQAIIAGREAGLGRDKPRSDPAG